jgi:phosphoserine phosphatase RsbU/P
MRALKTGALDREKKRKYMYMFTVFVFLFLSFRLAYIAGELFGSDVDVALFLTWHNIFEFSSILVSFAVFVVTYYTYEQTGNLRSVFLGTVFLSMGIIDFFHTFSYKGMPEFFVSNMCCANRATTFWIIARLTGAAGFFIAAFMPVSGKGRINKRLFVLPALVFCTAAFISVMYFPQVLPPMYIEGEGLTDIKIILEYIIIAFLAAAIIMYAYKNKGGDGRFELFFPVALLFSIFSEMAFVKYNSVYDIFNYLGHVYKVVSFYLIFRVMFVANVQKPYIQLTEAKNQLKHYAESLDELVLKRTRQLETLNRQLLGDLEYARNVQLSMLPPSLPREKNVVFSAKYFAAKRVSGDFYNIFKQDEDNLGMYICDVSGHGVSAAMLTIFIKQSMNTCGMTKTQGDKNPAPSQVLARVYEAFGNTNFKDEMYITLLYAVYNMKKSELIYASAGLNTYPILIKADCTVEKLPVKGLPICKSLTDYPIGYEDRSKKLSAGDKIIFYSDGLVEARNDKNECFSEKRLLEIIWSNCRKTADEISESITNEIFSFMGDISPKDDITFFVMEIKNA